jgi:signal transduction histidine kinase
MIQNDRFLELRKKAEEKMAKIASNLEEVSEYSIERLLHELSVHQIELEMQNDELRKTAQDLSETKNMFLKLYQNAPVAYLIVNDVGQIGMANNKFFETVGISPADSVKRKSLSEFVHFEDISLFYSVFKPFYNNPDKHKFELRLKNKYRIVNTVVTGYRYSEALGIYKDLAGYDLLIVLNDVTNIKTLEDELNRKNKALEDMNSTLQNRVEEETSQRIKHEQMLFEQKKFADMGEMLSSIAHQWRQPLNVLGLVLQSIADAACKDDDEMKELRKTGFDVISYLSETITDFRDFFKPAKDRVRFNIAAASYHALNLINRQIQESGIVIRFLCICNGVTYDKDFSDDMPECLDNLPSILGFENEFKQVFLNLIYNSRDAIICNGNVNKGEIIICVSDDDKEITLSVEDNGGGVPAYLGDKIFDPYFTTKKDMNGTGIGLYMCKTIIEKHFNGKVSFCNTDEGVIFKVIIPREDSSQNT